MRHAWIPLFAAKRLLYAIPLILGVIVINFMLIQLAPGDPATVLVGDFPVPEEYMERVRAEYGLDRSVPEQLIAYLGQLFQGNLGVSFSKRQDVLSLLLERLPATLELTLSAMVLATIVGVLLGIIAAKYRGRAPDSSAQVTTLLGFSVPEFWLGQMLIVLFAVTLGWLPLGGNAPVRGDGDVPFDLNYLILPAVALSFRYVALIARMTRSSILEVNSADFVTASRSRGVSESLILRRHTLKNAAPPVITVIGYNFGFILAGSVMVETVFGWPGIGRLLYESISSRDYPVMTAILLIISVTVVLANVLTDIVHALLDPRLERT
ncbi:MAG TPA: ABC transporter permease [Candidatus Ruania gallistercoris]|uniref:ABC transporter permease n=1 Tax=Candidatus Ruania gallistercoris TaxID=2838746 RepID=A0A9D2J450_9MICO|nr:ABC transporter permease [Candidatus Ruania gallistercoris]